MASPTRIQDLTAIGSLDKLDKLPVEDVSLNETRQATMQQLTTFVLAYIGIGTSTVAGLPSASPANKYLWVTDGRKVGEGAGLGTGVLCQSTGTQWRTVDAGTAVAA